jgi:hypothetical protein
MEVNGEVCAPDALFQGMSSKYPLNRMPDGPAVCLNVHISKREKPGKFEVLAAVAMKIAIFLGGMPCSLPDNYQCFGGTNYFQLKGCFYPEDGAAVSSKT